MKLFAILFCLVISLGIVKAQEETGVGTTDVSVIIGIPYIEDLDFMPYRDVHIERPDLIRATIQPEKKRIIFSAIKPGQTYAHVYDPSGNIKKKLIFNITATDQSKQLQRLQAYLGDIEGLEIGIKGDKVFIGGKIVVPEDIGRIVVVLQDLGEGVLRMVELAPQTQQVIGRKMQDEFRKQGMTDLTVRIINGSFWIEGVVASKDEYERAIKIAEAFIPDRLESLARQTGTVSTVSNRRSLIQPFISINAQQKPPEIPKLIKITGQFVELSKDYLKAFGFQWSPSMSSGGQIAFGKTSTNGVTTNSSGTLSGIISNLFPKLASAKSAGNARIIQSGVILVQNDVEGSIEKSVTTPYAIGSGEFQKAGEATAGFNLKVKPTILDNEKIQIQSGLEVSSTLGVPPEKLTNKISTTIVVKTKESAVIGGIVINKTSTRYDKDPPYGGSKIAEDDQESQFLFSFLKSKSYETSKDQFVVFITPEIVESASEGTDAIKKKFRKRAR